MNEARKQHNKFEKQMFALAFYLGLIVHFSAVMPPIIGFVLQLVSLACGLFGIFTFLYNRRLRIVQTSFLSNGVATENYIRGTTDQLKKWILLSTYMVFVGIINSLLPKGVHDWGWLISQDLRYVMYFAIGIIYADEYMVESYERIMLQLCVLSILFGFIALLNYGFDYSRIIFRIGVWQIPYYLWWASSSCFAYAYARARIIGENKIIYFGAFFFYIFLGLLFLKRVVVVNGIACVVIAEIILILKCVDRRTRRKKLTRLIFGMVIVAAVIVVVISSIPYLARMIELIMKRFDASSSGESYVESNDRIFEAVEYFKSAGLIRVFLGQGIGNYVYEYPGTAYQSLTNALHLGWANLVYKGGVIYFAFWVGIAIKVLKRFRHVRDMTSFETMCLAVSMNALVSLFYEFSWSYTIVILGYVTPLYTILKRDQE